VKLLVLWFSSVLATLVSVTTVPGLLLYTSVALCYKNKKKNKTLYKINDALHWVHVRLVEGSLFEGATRSPKVKFRDVKTVASKLEAFKCFLESCCWGCR
jgi:hypothetical protein